MTETTSLAELLGALGGDYVIRMKTDGLTSDGIREGDYLIVQQTSTAPEGALVVATIAGAATVRRLVTVDGVPWLQAQGPGVDPLPVDGKVKIVGRVIGMARSVK